MSDNESKNFENADLISLVSAPETARPSAKDEIDRGRKLYKERRGYKDTSDVVNLKPLYDKRPIKPKTIKTSSPYYYRLICDYPKPHSMQKTKPCHHSGNFILDRDILTRQEHDTFLARPRPVHAPKAMRRYCYYVKKYFSPCTYRIEQLALPKKRNLVEFYNEHADSLTPQQSENIARLLIDAKVTNVARAIELCNDEKRKQNISKQRNMREAVKFKRKILEEKKIMVRKIALNVFTAMQEFLLTDQDLTFNKNAKVLADVIANKILLYEEEDRVDRNSDSVLAKCVYSVADSLAVWMQKITQVCSFGSLLEKTMAPEPGKICSCEPPKKQTQYPIDDYIEYESSEVSECSASTMSDNDYEGYEEFEGYEGYQLQNVSQRQEAAPIEEGDAEPQADEGAADVPAADETAAEEPPPAEEPPAEDPPADEPAADAPAEE